MDSTNTPTAFRVHAASTVRHAEETTAVIFAHGQVAIGMSIAQARELSMALARAADEAELKLPQ